MSCHCRESNTGSWYDEIRGACSTHVDTQSVTNPKGRDHLEDLGVDGSTDLTEIRCGFAD
jgi:hypothetical protein